MEVVKEKKDIGKISSKSRKLKVRCELDKKTAVKIMSKCRLLEELEFDPHSFHETDEDVKNYLNRFLYLDVGK